MLWFDGEAKESRSRFDQTSSDFGICINGIIDTIELRENVERGSSKHLPLGSWECIEVLTASMGHVIMGSFAVLTEIVSYSYSST